MGNRVAYAQSVLDRFGNTEPGTSSSSSSSSGGGDVCTVDDTGAIGECISTGACADLGGTSTPGFCPGAADVQCCTDVPATGSSGTSQGGSSSGSRPPRADGGVAEEGDDDDGTAPLQREEPEFGDPGGCNAAGSASASGAWLAVLALALGARRKRATVRPPADPNCSTPAGTGSGPSTENSLDLPTRLTRRSALGASRAGCSARMHPRARRLVH